MHLGSKTLYLFDSTTKLCWIIRVSAHDTKTAYRMEMDLLNPLIVRMMGANINRRTVENVQNAGLILERVDDVGMGGIVKLIVARGTN